VFSDRRAARAPSDSCGSPALRAPGVASAQDQTITLGVGQQKVIQVQGGVQRIAVGDPEIADVKTIGSNEVLILGVAEAHHAAHLAHGESRLSYMISVRKQDPKEIVSEIRALLGDIEACPSASSATASTSTARRSPPRTPTACSAS